MHDETMLLALTVTSTPFCDSFCDSFRMLVELRFVAGRALNF